jgi:hypothetical protein
LISDEREYVDVGWYDTDDGTFVHKNDKISDDGGWYLGWGDVKEEVLEEIENVFSMESLEKQPSTESGYFQRETESKEELTADQQQLVTSTQNEVPIDESPKEEVKIES